MICKYCHNEMDNNSIFCPSCGKKVEAPSPNPAPTFQQAGNLAHNTYFDAASRSGSSPSKASFRASSGQKAGHTDAAYFAAGTPTTSPKTGKAKSGRKQYAIIAGAILGAMAIVLVLLFTVILPNQPINQLKSQIKARNYRQAQDTYEELDAEDRTTVNKWLQKYIADTEQKYYEGSFDYSTATDIIQKLESFQAIYDDAYEAIENIYLDNQSTMAYDRAKQYADNEQWKEAYEALQKIHVKYRLYDEVAELRAECEANYRSAVIAQIDSYAESEEIDKMIACKDEALGILSDDTEIIQSCQKHLDKFVEKTLSDATTFVNNGDYDSAIQLLQYASGMYSYSGFYDALSSYGYEAAVAHCEALAAQGDLTGALQYAQELADDDYNYIDLVDKYGQILVNDALSTAKAYADSRQFEEAISVINDAQMVYSSSELDNAAKEYGEYLPRKLSDCYEIDSEYVKVRSGMYDSFGNMYENVIGLGEWSKHRAGYCIYILDGKFTKLNGVIAPSNEMRNDDYMICRIYGDNKLLYESGKIIITTEAVNVSVDITNIKQLKVEFEGSGAYDAAHYKSFDAFGIVDVTVS